MVQRVFSGTVWERQAAYCRAIRVGSMVFVSGTTAIDENGNVVGDADVFAQSMYIFAKIREALAKLGAEMNDVVRTRSYLTDMSQFAGFANAHREAFEGIEPVATCVAVKCLVDSRLLVEVEVEAFKP